MKKRILVIKWIILAGLLSSKFCIFCPLNSAAQSYSPATEYHDPVQRVFVVEAARVLAWWAEHGATNLMSVTYDVTTKSDQGTVWEIRWLDATGKVAKTATVSYPAELLKSGPDFYRSVFKQLWMADWRHGMGLKPEEVVESYWRGAMRAGLSREESIERAWDLVAANDKTQNRVLIPELAGLLVSASLPAYAEVVTLDRQVLARGAAWLAFAEKSSNTKLDSLWAPVLFQAGRERAAAALWQANNPSKLEGVSPAQAGWNIWLRKPRSQEVFVFATSLTNLPMAMPMLAYDVRVNGTGKALAELIPHLVDTPPDLAKLHNYAPLFATETTVGGGHISNGSWAWYSRMAWQRLLDRYPAGSNDFQGYRKVLTEVRKKTSPAPKTDSEQDLSLTGFTEFAPLLSLAKKEGIGNLATTPICTARDLLNYGWEMAGWQMGSRYRFVRYWWGVPEQADPIYKTVTTQVEGLMAFFKNEAEANLSNYSDLLSRLEQVEGLFQLVGWSTPPPDKGRETLAGTRLFVKRCWLRPRDLEWQVRALWDVKAMADIPDIIQTQESESGSLMAAMVLSYLSDLNDDALAQLPKGAELKYSTAETLPDPTLSQVRAVFEKKYRDLDNFARAQAYERLYWQNPDSGLEGRTLFNYMMFGAYDSVRRFYNEARSNFQDPVGFSSRSGVELYTLGFALDDSDLREKVLVDSASGSYSDMMMHVWEAAIRDNPKEIKAAAEEMVERYEQEQGVNSMGRRLLKFLPLLPALKDPKSSSRKEALEFFGREDGWAILRFIWIEKYKIPAADAVVFLSGRENSTFNQLLIAYLEKNREKALDALNALNSNQNSNNEYRVLGSCLYQKLHPDAHLYKDKDLKPPGAMTIRQAVFKSLEAHGRLGQQK